MHKSQLMKKKVFTFLSLGAAFFIHAQEQSLLHAEFGKQHQENVKKLTEFQNKTTAKISDINQNPANLATVMNGVPLFWKSEDVEANNSSNIPPLQNGTLSGLTAPIDGSGISILLMDTGKIFEKHNEFGNPSRIILRETDTAPYSPHSTMVTGVIGGIASATLAKGVLPKSTFENYFFGNTSLGTNYQKLEAAKSANISNHSYGTNLGWSKSGNAWYWYGDYELYKTTKEDTYGGSYHELDANYDKIVYKNPNHIVVKSTGNYFGLGPTANDTSAKYRIDNATGNYIPFLAGEELPGVNCKDGFYCIGWGALSKNIISVAAVNQLSTSGNLYSAPNDVQRWANSSAGPRRDGAVKPDISAVGGNMYVPTYTSETGVTSYTTSNGTSLSAAMISGIAGALTQLNRQVTGNAGFIYQADEMKALLAHTANEAGNIGPDVWYGWGLADAQKAAEVIISKKDNRAVFEQKTLTSGTPQEFEIVAGYGQPLKATISWVDPAAVPFTTSAELQNNHSSRLVNDLDLRIIDTANGTVYYPWKLNIDDPMAPATKGDNTVDNIEQVVVEDPVVGRVYKVVVSNKGNLVNDAGTPSPSKYSIVVTGTHQTLGLPSDCESISVFPGRTKDFVTVIVPMEAERISIYDMSGRLIRETVKPTSQMLDLTSLSKGVYMINVKSQYCNKTKRILKE